MIRLTVEQLMALRDSMETTGQVQSAVLPLELISAKSLIVAWARGREVGSEYYLTVWKDTASVIAAKKREREEGYVFEEPDREQSYKHVYVPTTVNGDKVDVEKETETEAETDVHTGAFTAEAQTADV